MTTLLSLLEATKFTHINVPAFAGNWLDYDWLDNLPNEFDRYAVVEASGLCYDSISTMLDDLVKGGRISVLGRRAAGRGNPRIIYVKTKRGVK